MSNTGFESALVNLKGGSGANQSNRLNKTPVPKQELYQNLLSEKSSHRKLESGKSGVSVSQFIKYYI